MLFEDNETTNDNTVLSAAVIADIQERVKRVTALLKRSAAIWLEIGEEFGTAKRQLKPLAYERFINDTGITKSVADKLVAIGRCRRLYAQDSEPFIASIEGWSPLYEISKLKESQIDSLWETLGSNPSIRLTREVVQNIANGNTVDDKVIVFASIEAQKSKLDRLTPLQAKEFSVKLDEINVIFGNTPKAFVWKKRDASIKLLSDIQTSNSTPQMVKTAA